MCPINKEPQGENWVQYQEGVHPAPPTGKSSTLQLNVADSSNASSHASPAKVQIPPNPDDAPMTSAAQQKMMGDGLSGSKRPRRDPYHYYYHDSGSSSDSSSHRHARRGKKRRPKGEPLVMVELPGGVQARVKGSMAGAAKQDLEEFARRR